MLSQNQIEAVWERRISSDVRSLYFADLAYRYSRLKQIITFSSFFLSSAAAAILVAKLPEWIAIVLSVAVAAANAYSVASSLDRRIRTLAKLHSSWSELSHGYDRLWNHTYEDDAEDQLADLARQERELSELAATDAPYDPELLNRWQDHVIEQYHLKSA